MVDFFLAIGMLLVFASIAWLIVDIVKLLNRKSAKVSYTIILFFGGWFVAFLGQANSIGTFLLILAVGVIIEWTIYSIAQAVKKDKRPIPNTKHTEANSEQITTSIVKSHEAQSDSAVDTHIKNIHVSMSKSKQHNTTLGSTNDDINKTDSKQSIISSDTQVNDKEFIPNSVLTTRKRDWKSHESSVPMYKKFIAAHGAKLEDVSHLKPRNYIVFDLETTGLSYKTDEIIQISAIKVVDDKEVAYFNEFIKPTTKIPSEITALTGITDKQVSDADPISDVMRIFNSFVENGILVGHNIDVFDIPFLLNNGFTQKSIKSVDTLHMTRRLFDAFPVRPKNMKLKTLKEYFGLNNGSHNALEDCKTNLVVYQKLRDHDLEYKVPISQDPNSELKGLSFVLTGHFNKLKKEIIEEINGHCGRVTGTVSGKTDYLIDGEQIPSVVTDGKHSAKELKAHELQKEKGKIKIIAYPQLAKLIDSRKSNTNQENQNG